MGSSPNKSFDLNESRASIEKQNARVRQSVRIFYFFFKCLLFLSKKENIKREKVLRARQYRNDMFIDLICKVAGTTKNISAAAYSSVYKREVANIQAQKCTQQNI